MIPPGWDIQFSYYLLTLRGVLSQAENTYVLENHLKQIQKKNIPLFIHLGARWLLFQDSEFRRYDFYPGQQLVGCAVNFEHAEWLHSTKEMEAALAKPRKNIKVTVEQVQVWGSISIEVVEEDVGCMLGGSAQKNILHGYFFSFISSSSSTEKEMLMAVTLDLLIHFL